MSYPLCGKPYAGMDEIVAGLRKGDQKGTFLI